MSEFEAMVEEARAGARVRRRWAAARVAAAQGGSVAFWEREFEVVRVMRSAHCSREEAEAMV
jgi:hypothetical protein